MNEKYIAFFQYVRGAIAPRDPPLHDRQTPDAITIISISHTNEITHNSENNYFENNIVVQYINQIASFHW